MHACAAPSTTTYLAQAHVERERRQVEAERAEDDEPIGGADVHSLDLVQRADRGLDRARGRRLDGLAQEVLRLTQLEHEDTQHQIL